MIKKTVYMDYHATTPVDPEVLKEMLPYFSERFGNPASTQHRWGLEALAAVDLSRKRIAAVLEALSEEIIFTSGATESNNLALLGVMRSHKKGSHFITAETEHSSILETAHVLEREGFPVTRLPVDSTGQVNPSDLEKAITPQTVLVSFMAANNEVGTLHPLSEIGEITSKKGILFHVDAAQAAGKISLSVKKLKINLLSFSSHKIYGPKGVGALWIEKTVRAEPLIYGGGHEKGLRSGTLNVPGIVGFGKALELAWKYQAAENERLLHLREKLKTSLLKEIPNLKVLGHPTQRLSHNLNILFPGVRSDKLMMNLREIALSSGSACHSVHGKGSHVLRAIGLRAEEANSCLRFGLGRYTTEEEVDYVAARVIDEVHKMGS